MIEIIEKYFPNLTEEQKKQFEALDALYHDWNSKINVISRKDIDNLYEHHVLHSLAIAKAIHFLTGRAIFVLNTPCRAKSSREVTKEQTANLYHRNFTSAGYSASSVEKYHCPN